MKVIAFSDPHGLLPPIKEGFDLLLLPGDVCPVWNHSRPFQKEWLTTTFAEWVKALPFKNEWSKVVMCAGNHDLCLEGASRDFIAAIEEAAGGRLVYLNEDTYRFEAMEDDGTFVGYNIYATPICKVFGSWAFMREDLDKHYRRIPENIDILISHDAPDINNLGMISMGTYAGENAGNTVLAEYIKKVRPRYALCGHIHSGNHELTEIDGTFYANVSYVNERYVPEHEPLVFEIKKPQD